MTITPDKLRKDAERYRFIRSHAGSAMDWDWWPLEKHGHVELDASELLDFAIDAAMKGEK